MSYNLTTSGMYLNIDNGQNGSSIYRQVPANFVGKQILKYQNETDTTWHKVFIKNEFSGEVLLDWVVANQISINGAELDPTDMSGLELFFSTLGLKVPPVLGQNDSNTSLSVVPATDAIFNVNPALELNHRRIVSAATTNKTSIQPGLVKLFRVDALNTLAIAANRYIKFYDASDISLVTVGTTVPVFTMLVRAASLVTGMEEKIWDNGFVFQNGIVIATVTGSADSDVVAVGAGDLIMNFQWRG